MPRVVCHLPNAGHSINGVRFASIDGGGMLSEEISEEAAAAFCAIRGYTVYVPKAETRPHHEPAAAPVDKRTSAGRLAAASHKETS